jgi:hypothetical protein
MKMTRKRFKSGSSCGRDSAALDCPMSLSSKILRLVWKLKVTETTSQEVESSSRVVEYLFLDVV